MSPIPVAGEETVPPMEGKAVPGAGQVPPTSAAPTKVDAYKARGLRSKHSPLDLVPVLLRILTAVFSLIAFAVIASNKLTVIDAVDGLLVFTTKYTFSSFFFFSYLLTVNVIAFCYALATIFVSLFLLSKSSVSNSVLNSIFVLDQILSYLLISASTSAATGLRIYKGTVTGADDFINKASAAIAFSFLTFFVLAGAAVIAGYRVARRP